jgi:hypothetical protein
VFPDPLAVHDAAGLSPHGWMRNPGLVDVWFVPRTVPPDAWREVVGGREPASVPSLRAAPVASRAGSIRWRVTRWDRLSKSVIVESAGGPLVLHQFWFPGFRTFVDGSERPVRPDPPTGLLSLEVPPGAHEVSWDWKPFAPLPAARVVSAASAAAVLGLLAIPAVRRQRPARELEPPPVSPEAPRR